MFYIWKSFSSTIITSVLCQVRALPHQIHQKHILGSPGSLGELGGGSGSVCPGTANPKPW